MNDSRANEDIDENTSLIPNSSTHGRNNGYTSLKIPENIDSEEKIDSRGTFFYNKKGKPGKKQTKKYSEKGQQQKSIKRSKWANKKWMKLKPYTKMS